MGCKDGTGDASEDTIEIPENAGFSARQARTSNELRIDDELTDVTIISEGQKFRCHSHVLASSSEMLLAIFRTAMKESNKRQIELPTVPPNIVKIILAYIYLRTVRVPSDLLLDTIKAADYLRLHELKDDCLQQSYQALKPSNVFSYHKLAHELDLEELIQRCSTMMSSSLAEIAVTSEFQQLSQVQLIGYFDDLQEFEVDNDDKLDALIKWVSQDPTLRIKDMQALVDTVDLSRCSVQCIDETFKNHSALLDKEMCMKLAQSFATIASQIVVRKKRRGRKRIVVVAGHRQTCWEVDESMAITELCQGFQCTERYSACEVPHGFVLTGGKGSAICMMYVVSLQSWIPLASMKAARWYHASICMQGKLFVFGGFMSGISSKSVQSLQLDGGDWVDEPDLPFAVEDPEVARINFEIFLLNVYSNQLMCFDKKARVWKNKAHFPKNKAQHPERGAYGVRMISVNDQLLVAGGPQQCARFIPSTNTWIICNQPTLVHHLGALICHDHKIYLMGGTTTNVAEEYDLERDTWSLCDWTLPSNVLHLQAILIEVP